MSIYKIRNKGFTLIEIIMTLVLISVVGALGTLGLSTFVKNFTVAKQGTESASDAQLVMLRIAKELKAVSAVSFASPTTITFTSLHEDGYKTYTISQSGSNLNMTVGGSTDNLSHNVASNGFSLQYYTLDYSTGSLVERTSDPYWVAISECCNPIELQIEKSECKDDDLKLDFTGPTDTYVVYYNSTSYFACLKDGEYQASDDATDSSSCEDQSANDEVKDVDFYDKAYVYSTSSGASCYAEIEIKDDDCDDGSNSNPPPFALQSGTRIIKVNLQIKGIAEPFSVSISPRNLSPCP